MVVLTGGPGSGKTSIIKHLQQLGYHVAKESGREVLQRDGGMVLRETNPLDYALAMLELDMQNFASSIAIGETTIFDRGIPDIAGYLDLMGIQIPELLDQTCTTNRYTGPIFAAPPWHAIYRNDNERTQSFQDACKTYEAVCSAWKRYDYDLIELPKASVKDRAEFVQNKLN